MDTKVKADFMANATAAIIGGTGLIGSLLHQQIVAQKAFETVRLLVRRPLQKPDPITEIKLINFEDRESFQLALEGVDVVFCAVGTTQKKVKGDEGAYRKVDFDIPVNAAKYAAQTGVQHFSLVSAVGANASSSNFYVRLKGEAEDAVRAAGLPSVAVFRPSLLLGDRSESRTGEKIAQKLMPIFSGLLLGSLSKYKPIEASAVAAVMLRKAKHPKPGFQVYHFDEMQAVI